MTAHIPECRAGDDPAAMYEALDDAGCLVVHDMVEPDARAAVRSDMGEHMAAAKAAHDRPDDVYPGLTRRSVALMHRSPTTRRPDDAPRRLRSRRSPSARQLHEVAAQRERSARGWPRRDQVLHREENLYPFFVGADPGISRAISVRQAAE